RDQMRIPRQQPSEQYSSAAQSSGASQGVPSSHIGGGVPPSGASKQSAGRSSAVRPGQSSQRPQVLLHSSLGVHGVQALGSSMSSTEQVLVARTSTVVPSSRCTVQQPKQSQPFG